MINQNETAEFNDDAAIERALQSLYKIAHDREKVFLEMASASMDLNLHNIIDCAFELTGQPLSKMPAMIKGYQEFLPGKWDRILKEIAQ